MGRIEAMTPKLCVILGRLTFESADDWRIIPNMNLGESCLLEILHDFYGKNVRITIKVVEDNTNDTTTEKDPNVDLANSA